MRCRLIAIALFAYAFVASAAIPQSERDALVAFYNAAGGPGWTNHTNWLGAAGTECTWFGVYCTNDQTTVIGIELDNNNLAGTIPSDVAKLTNLQFLVLSDAPAISGPIPPELGGLTHLLDLHLQNLSLTGGIPSSLGNLSTLETLYLTSDKLSGTIPPELGNLGKLKELLLYDNQLSGSIPPQLGNPAAMTYLSLDDNQLTGAIPPELGHALALQILRLPGNKLTGPIPKELANLTSLQELEISDNQINGAIPPELGQLSKLTQLNAESDKLSGSIPPQLGNLQSLQQLDLARNQLTGAIPPELGKLGALTSLQLWENQLSGTIPPQLGDLASLKNLSLSTNSLTGSIPPELAHLPNLTYLDLAANQLTGSIPAGLGNVSSLVEIHVNANQLSGALPVELSALSNLENLDVSSNQLTGSIPAAYAKLAKLKYLSVHVNSLSGPLPSLSGMTNLQELVAYSNSLSGTLPSDIGNLTNLDEIAIGGNQFTGSIPASIGNLTALSFLDLSGNQFSGPIPPQIGQLANLQDMTLASNQLSGTIPSTIGNLAKLQNLDLAYNFLTGTIPPLGGLKSAQTLYFNDNELEGTLPPDIATLTGLTALGLGANRFSGPIPTTLGSLTALQSLDLGANAFRGPVPPEITRLTSLTDGGGLQVSYNALTSSDATILAFIKAKQGYDLGNDQTVPATNVTAANATDRSVVVSWNPITYDYDDGGYQVTATAAGALDVVTMTADKDATQAIVHGLKPSTTYTITVRTVTNPHDIQQNLVTSDPAPAVTATTTAPVLSPADVEITANASGLIQVGGVPQNQDSFILTNFGDVTASVTLSTEDTFFTMTPTSFNLAGGASQTVVLTSLPQPPNSYYGFVGITADGKDLEDGIYVYLLSVAKPSGTVIAQPVVTRVDTAGDPNTTTIGTVTFRNVGTATLNGILVSDVPWITTPPSTVTIYAGDSTSINFTVDRTKRPDAGTFGGALSANLRLLYLDGDAGTTSLGVRTSSSATTGRPRPVASSGVKPPDETSGGGGRGRPHSQDNTPPPGLSVSIVTVVDTTKPPVTASTIPAIVAPEVARFIAGVGAASTPASKQLTDLNVANAFGIGNVNDLKMYFTPAGAASSSVASFGAVPPAQSIALANIASNVYGSSGQTGTLQIRSARIGDLMINAMRTNFAGAVAVRTALPIFRSDRAIAAGQALYLTGIAKSGTTHTTLDVQETSGVAATVQIRFVDANGAAVGAARPPDSIPAFGLLDLVDGVPAGAVTAIVTNQTGSTGKVVAYATVTNDAAGEAFTIVDWSRYFALKPTDTLAVPYASSAASSVSRHRAVAKDAAQTTRTELTLYNSGTAAANAILHFYDASGSATSQTITVPAGQTRVIPDAVQLLGRSGSGTLSLDPLKGATLVATARLLNAAGGADVSGLSLPVLSGGAGLRLGQLQTFAGLEDSSPATVAAKTPGTSSTSFGIVETGGDRVTVRATMRYTDGRSLVVSQNVSRDYQLAPYQSIVVDPMASAILGSARDSLGDLHDVQLVLQVVSGNGAATVFTVTTDNASGRSVLRVE